MGALRSLFVALVNEPQWVYNIEVDTDHSYYVGELGLLVHNTDNCGRQGRQARLRAVKDDPNESSANHGWVQQEMNSIDRGQRSSIRNPPGKELAHERGREAAKGYGYEYSTLQDRDLHKLQHKYDDKGRANTERPVINEEDQ